MFNFSLKLTVSLVFSLHLVFACKYKSCLLLIQSDPVNQTSHRDVLISAGRITRTCPHVTRQDALLFM